VHRSSDAGRYVLTDVIAEGPAMFDTIRLDQATGPEATDGDPITQLSKRVTDAGLHTAALDEVLCIADVRHRRP
jgi:hypothetical protein